MPNFSRNEKGFLSRIRNALRVSCFAALMAVVSLPSHAYAATTVWTVSADFGNVTCGKVGSKNLSGTGSSSKFVSHKSKIASLKIDLRKAKKSKQAKIRAAITKLTQRQKLEDPFCSSGPPTWLVPTPTPTVAPLTNFDSNGNVTAKGKALFQIPTQYTANVGTGSDIWVATCRGCHASEKTNRTFPTITTRIAASPMFLTLSGGQVANLTAYLNRFRTN